MPADEVAMPIWRQLTLPYTSVAARKLQIRQLPSSVPVAPPEVPVQSLPGPVPRVTPSHVPEHAPLACEQRALRLGHLVRGTSRALAVLARQYYSVVASAINKANKHCIPAACLGSNRNGNKTQTNPSNMTY